MQNNLLSHNTAQQTLLVHQRLDPENTIKTGSGNIFIFSLVAGSGDDPTNAKVLEIAQDMKQGFPVVFGRVSEIFIDRHLSSLLLGFNGLLLFFFEFVNKLVQILQRFVNVMDGLSSSDHRERGCYGELQVGWPGHSSWHALISSVVTITS